MKVFLGNAPWRDLKKKDYYGVKAGSRWPHFEPNSSRYMPFPFFLAYATAVLKENHYDVKLVDGIAEGISNTQFLQKIQDYSPDLVVLETSTPSIMADIKMAERIKNICQAKVAFCGPHAPMYSQNFLKENPIIDFILQGEYEYALLNLVRHLEKHQDLDDILGLIYRNEKDNTIHINPRQPLIENLDELPWPERDSLPMERYFDAVVGLPAPSVQMWASRGCPYKCIFCSWPQIMYGSHKYRVRNPINVVDEMEWLIKERGFKSVYFDDDTFNIGKKRILQICEEIKRRNLNNIPWAIMARADTMDDEMLKALKSAGLYALKYGVESGVQEIVDKSEKNLDLKQVREIVKRTKELNIRVHLTFAFGLPGETKETINKTIEFALELDPDSVQFSIVTPFPGSRYFAMLEEKGLILTKDWEEYDGSNRAVLRTEALSGKELEDALCNAYKRWNFHQFRKNKLKYLIKGLLHPLNGFHRLMEYILFMKRKDG